MSGIAPAPETPRFEVLATGFQFVEAPRVADDGTIYFSDLTGGGFYRRLPSGEVETVLADRNWIGGSVLNRDGTVTVSGPGGLLIVDPASGRTRELLTEINGEAVDAVNDIEADDTGAIYGGSIDFSAILGRGEQGRPGVLFRLDPSGAVEVIRDGVKASNGIGFSPDRSRFYHSESSVGVWVYDHAPGERPRNPVLFVELDDSDGLVVDARGGVWVARWNTGELRRYLPDGGLDRIIRLPFPNLISLAFGGPDLTDLYVATGGAGPDGRTIGGIVRIVSDIPGQPAARSGFTL